MKGLKKTTSMGQVAMDDAELNDRVDFSYKQSPGMKSVPDKRRTETYNDG